MEKSNDIHVISSSSITSHPSPELFECEQVIDLSPLDAARIYTPYQKRVIFFTHDGQNHESLTASLKHSLPQALAHFYPFTGRVIYSDDHNSRLQLHRNNAGVVFLEARCDATLHKLHPEYLLPSQFCDRLCQMMTVEEPHWPWKPADPLLAIQVTRFACGGISIGASYSSQICDGPTFWSFMNCWSQITRTGALEWPAPSITYRIAETIPAHGVRIGESTFEGFELVPRETAKKIALQTGWRNPGNGISLKLLKFSAGELRKLQEVADSEFRFNTYRVICGYIWKKMCLSWDKPDDEPTTLYLYANSRGKGGAVPSLYFGNGLMGVAATSSVGEIRSKPWSFGTELVHDAIEAHTNDKVCRVAKWMADSTKPGASFQGCVPMCAWNTGSNVLVVDSPKQPIYSVDFGWGRPASKSFGVNDLAHNQIYFAPSPGCDGGIDITVALEDATMKLFDEQLP